MTSFLRKTMLYLGLAPDEEFEEYDDFDERAPEPAPSPIRPNGQAVRTTAMPPSSVAPGRISSVPGPVMVPADEPDARPGMASVRPLPVADPPVTAINLNASPVVRPAQNRIVARPSAVRPKSFTDAQEIADRYKANQPVIMNLQGIERELSRRLIDFASGLCYGLAGQMEKVGQQVFLLTPAEVEVPLDERRRLLERGVEEP